jgi:hypothetical protein
MTELADLYLCDESSKFHHIEHSWVKSIQPTLVRGGKLILVSAEPLPGDWVDRLLQELIGGKSDKPRV